MSACLILSSINLGFWSELSRHQLKSELHLKKFTDIILKTNCQKQKACIHRTVLKFCHLFIFSAKDKILHDRTIMEKETVQYFKNICSKTNMNDLTSSRIFNKTSKGCAFSAAIF